LHLSFWSRDKKVVFSPDARQGNEVSTTEKTETTDTHRFSIRCLEHETGMCCYGDRFCSPERGLPVCTP
jgi:hypothetical protein